MSYLNRLRRWFLADSGQSLAVLALGLTTLLAVVGLAVDVGNAYAAQRKVRNAVDAAALAGAREYAEGALTTNAQVLGAVRRFAGLNDVSPDDVTAWYADYNGNALEPINNDGYPPPAQVDGVDVSAVLVHGRKTVPAYLAHLVGVRSFSANQESLALVVCGVCSAGRSGKGLFPAAISQGTFGEWPVMGGTYRFWGTRTAPGNFAWVSWNDDPGHTSNATLVTNLMACLNGPNQSGEWQVDPDNGVLYAGPGVMGSSGVSAALTELVANGPEVTVPVYNLVTGTGSNVRYNIVGFVSMRLTSFDLGGPDRYIEGTIVQGVQGPSESGCPNFGVCTVKLRPPLTEARSISGTVVLWQPRIEGGSGAWQERTPVDVVHVFDTSASMDDRWGQGQEKKIVTARAAVTAFNDLMMPDAGDRVGLVSFPRVTSGARYGLECSTGTSRSYYGANIAAALTSDVGAVNTLVQGLSTTGAAPLAAAIQAGKQVLMPDGTATEGRMPVMIITSDGIANCTLDGKWTGQDGSTSPACNDLAVSQAIGVANMAKQAGIVIYTIAIGSGFDDDLLEAVATEAADPSQPHHFVAATRTDLPAIYQTIAARLNGEEGDCVVRESDVAGGGTAITIRRDGEVYAQTTASESGNFIFTPVDSGTYTFSASVRRDGLLYDVLTETIGGPAAQQPITVTVGQSTGTYARDLYLRTSTSLQCR